MNKTQKILAVSIGIISVLIFWHGPLTAQTMVGPDAGNTLPEIGVSLIPQFNKAAPGERFAIAVILDIPEKNHLYPNPMAEDAIGLPTEIIPQPVEGLLFGKPSYPPGESHKDPASGDTYDAYLDEVVIYLPVMVETRVGEYALPIDIPLSLDLSGLICSDDGSCVPWNTTANLTITAAAKTAGNYEGDNNLFAGLEEKNLQWPQDGQPGKTDAQDTTPAAGAVTPEDAASTDIAVAALPDYEPVEISGEKQQESNWLVLILMSIVAGFLLNFMPCVLPVIPIKVLSIIQQGQKDVKAGDKYKPVKLSLVFSAGILLVFIGLAIVMSAFGLLYGQQFQSQTFKMVMFLIVFVLSLSMLGIFEINVPGKLANVNIVREGYLGALGMGALATLLATPCSAPLLGPVLAWSLSQTMLVTVTVFTIVGIGMAFPYVLLTAFPDMLNKIPKAGNWMLYLKQGLGFVMLGVAAYLIFLFPPQWHFPLVLFSLLLGLAIWLGFHVVNMNTPTVRKTIGRLCAVLLVGLGAWGLHYFVAGQALVAATSDKPAGNTKLEAEPFSLAQLQAYHAHGKTVMVEFTADWCPNCKYIEATVIHTDRFKSAIKENDVVFVQADWTHQDQDITSMLNKLGSKSIPFTAIFPGDNPKEPVVLRDIYTLNTVLKAIDKATK